MIAIRTTIQVDCSQACLAHVYMSTFAQRGAGCVCSRARAHGVDIEMSGSPQGESLSRSAGLLQQLGRTTHLSSCRRGSKGHAL